MQQSTRNAIVWYGGATALGGTVGLIGSAWSRRAAQAAVDVRPALAEVGFLDALFANHAGDWLYYQYPTAMTIVKVLFVVVLTIVTAFAVRNG